MRHALPVSLGLMAAAVAGWLAFKPSPPPDPHDGGAWSLDAASQARGMSAARFVGRQTCVPCHSEEYANWVGSHHDLAMQVADGPAVLGNFDHAQFTHSGITSTFYKRNGKFMVRTDGPDGQLHDYEIAYTFGTFPLQQYLVGFPGGHFQALSIAWDGRSESEGGQRWFHLYPNETIDHNDILHWTGRNQNWNYMCAECHSTNLKKNYNRQSDRYETTLSEIDVSCEACHGPASLHVAWAEQNGDQGSLDPDSDKGLILRLHERTGVEWVRSPASDAAHRSTPRTSNIEIEMCARCHARRRVLSEDYVPGRPLLDTHVPVLLTEGMYHADGQTQAEVYVYGSFLQSKMYQAGVTCSDCHEPHSLKLRVPGKGVCLQCHRPEKYDSPAHHFHPVESTGADCIECHMPATTYMLIDPRHDHSIRIPRPDLSVTLGTPNACNTCHTDRSAQWAVSTMSEWYETPQEGMQDYGNALHAGRTGAPSAEQRLMDLADDPTQPNIARATALADLRHYPSSRSIPVIQRGLHDPDPMVRVAAVGALQAVAPRERLPLLLPVLEDPLLAVRIQAARLLASAPADQLNREQGTILKRGITEYIAAQQTNAERPEAQLNLGALYAERGQWRKSESAYRRALKLEPAFIPAYVNLADLYRLEGKDEAGERSLRRALTVAPRNAAVHHALGLLLVRQKRMAEAVPALARSAGLGSEDPRYPYVYAVALHSTGRSEKAITVLEESHTRHPYDRDTLSMLVTLHQKTGNTFVARRYAEKLLALSPRDPTARRLRELLPARQ